MLEVNYDVNLFHVGFLQQLWKQRNKKMKFVQKKRYGTLMVVQYQVYLKLLSRDLIAINRLVLLIKA